MVTFFDCRIASRRLCSGKGLGTHHCLDCCISFFCLSSSLSLVVVFTPSSENGPTLGLVLYYHPDLGVTPVRVCQGMVDWQANAQAIPWVSCEYCSTISSHRPFSSHRDRIQSPGLLIAPPIPCVLSQDQPNRTTRSSSQPSPPPRLSTSFTPCTHTFTFMLTVAVRDVYSFVQRLVMTSGSTAPSGAPPRHRLSYERTDDGYVIQQSSSGADQSWPPYAMATKRVHDGRKARPRRREHQADLPRTKM